MNKTFKVIILVVLLVIGAFVGWTLLKAIIGIVVFMSIVLVGWAGLEIGRFFPHKKKSKKSE